MCRITFGLGFRRVATDTIDSSISMDLAITSFPVLYCCSNWHFLPHAMCTPIRVVAVCPKAHKRKGPSNGRGEWQVRASETHVLRSYPADSAPIPAS